MCSRRILKKKGIKRKYLLDKSTKKNIVDLNVLVKKKRGKKKKWKEKKINHYKVNLDDLVGLYRGYKICRA